MILLVLAAVLLAVAVGFIADDAFNTLEDAASPAPARTQTEEEKT